MRDASCVWGPFVVGSLLGNKFVSEPLTPPVLLLRRSTCGHAGGERGAHWRSRDLPQSTQWLYYVKPLEKHMSRPGVAVRRQRLITLPVRRVRGLRLSFQSVRLLLRLAIGEGARGGTS